MKNKENRQRKYKLTVYNDPTISFEDVINAFKYINFTTLQAEQCALIIHSVGKYDLMEGDVYKLDNIRVMLRNTYNITSEVFPIKETKTNHQKINKVMEEQEQITDARTEQLFNDMKHHWSEFEENHLDFSKTGKKKAAARARKAIQSLKSIITEYKKSSVEECKM